MYVIMYLLNKTYVLYMLTCYLHCVIVRVIFFNWILESGIF